MREYKKPAVEVVELAFSGSIAIMTPNTVTGRSIMGSSDSGISLLNEPNGQSTSGDITVDPQDF